MASATLAENLSLSCTCLLGEGEGEERGEREGEGERGGGGRGEGGGVCEWCVRCGALQYNTVQYNTVQHSTTVQCGTYKYEHSHTTPNYWHNLRILHECTHLHPKCDARYGFGTILISLENMLLFNHSARVRT